jgi:hypothetical protein
MARNPQSLASVCSLLRARPTPALYQSTCALCIFVLCHLCVVYLAAVKPTRHLYTRQPVANNFSMSNQASLVSVFEQYIQTILFSRLHSRATLIILICRQPPKERCLDLASTHSHSLTHNSALRRAACRDYLQASFEQVCVTDSGLVFEHVESQLRQITRASALQTSQGSFRECRAAVYPKD